MWTVFLTGTIEQTKQVENTYGVGYFPRRYHYNADAVREVERLTRQGFSASLQRTKEYEAVGMSN